MSLLQGKKGIVFGIANERSYAYFITKQLLAQGAECAFTHLPIGKMEARLRKAVASLGVEDPWIAPFEAGSDESLDTLFTRVHDDFGDIDFVVHSIAFADKDYLKPDMFHQTPRQTYLDAIDVSAFSLVAITNRAMKIMPNGGSILSLSFYGGEKVMPGYNVMGVAKACLEHTTRYLAYEMGDADRKIRVNCISAGPLKTLAGAAFGGMDQMLEHQSKKSPLKRPNTGEEVGNTAVYLLSDLSSAVTGETIHVDAGYSIVGL